VSWSARFVGQSLIMAALGPLRTEVYREDTEVLRLCGWLFDGVGVGVESVLLDGDDDGDWDKDDSGDDDDDDGDSDDELGRFDIINGARGESGAEKRSVEYVCTLQDATTPCRLIRLGSDWIGLCAELLAKPTLSAQQFPPIQRPFESSPSAVCTQRRTPTPSQRPHPPP